RRPRLPALPALIRLKIATEQTAVVRKELAFRSAENCNSLVAFVGIIPAANSLPLKEFSRQS
ncbi:MAG: hypothetical protein KDD66_10425, partial [Bdellovibrionales bacterium]|nr:hypothetical protein [Bdellovibrionales bacterium]